MILRAFPSWDDGLPEPLDNDDDDFGLKVQKKVYRSKIFVSDRANHRTSLILTLLSEPVDRLWLELEAADERGNAIRDLLSSTLSPFRRAIRSLEASLVSGTEMSHCLSPLAIAFCQWPAHEVEMKRTARGICVSMYLQIFWRFVDLFEDWPFLFAIAAHASHDATKFQERVGKCYAVFELILE